MSQFAFQFSHPRLPAPTHRRGQSRPAGVPGRPESQAAAQQHPGIVSDQAHSAHPQVSFAPAADAQPNRQTPKQQQQLNNNNNHTTPLKQQLQLEPDL